MQVVHAEGTSSSTLDQALRDSSTNGMLANGAAHREHPFASASAQPQQQTLCLLFGGFTGGGVDGTMLAVDAGTLSSSVSFALISTCEAACHACHAALLHRGGQQSLFHLHIVALIYMRSPAVSFKGHHDAMLIRLLAGAASSTIEVCDRGPKDIGDMSLRPLPRFAHSAVVVPSSFCGKHSMVRLPHTYMLAFAACAVYTMGSYQGPCNAGPASPLWLTQPAQP